MAVQLLEPEREATRMRKLCCIWLWFHMKWYLIAVIENGMDVFHNLGTVTTCSLTPSYRSLYYSFFV